MQGRPGDKDKLEQTELLYEIIGEKKAHIIVRRWKKSRRMFLPDDPIVQKEEAPPTALDIPHGN